jgi:ABC-type branched-subunit amino acid transport system ATPase component
MLAVRDLRVSYRKSILGLRDVSLDVPAGAVVAVLGGNGAGKTTLLRAISGVLDQHGGAVDRGSIEFEGRTVVGRPTAAVVSSGIVLCPEGRQVFGALTVAENLRIGGFLTRDRAAAGRSREFVYELFPVLRERGDQRAGLLSGGEQQMLAIGRALMSAPRLLLLDEPSLGLAPLIVGRIGEVIKEINSRGTTVVVVEQNAAMALSVATHAYVLTTGEVSLSGPAEAMVANDTVRDLYLGGETVAAVQRELTATAGVRPALRRWTP